MDSNTKEPYQNNANIIPNNELNKNETISKQTHQHNFTPQYYPFVHQHPQILNRSHMHQFQSPLLLNIPSAQQMQHPNATHRHFQYSPQYTVSHENAQFFAKNQMFAHQHIPRINNQLPQDHSQEAQVWLPQQPPTIKCDPQEQKENNLKKEIYTSTPNQSNTKLTPPKTKDTDKKKSGGFNPQLRSPCPRRPTGAPVTMQGWLHKQGSEGLMLWKKRWFVLSEYCLFYYKGSAEEKLLGSILLPSYKVSLCKPEDKVYRKYAFKCEHANMRTYVLAADSQELLLQWVHLLTLACNLQTNIGTEKIKQDSIPSIKPSISTETSETFTQNNLNKTPLHTHTPSNTTDLSNSTQQELNQYNQPLYANAPPKPRRLNDGCYSSPSSDMLDKYGYTQYMPPVHYPRNTSKSPLDIYRQYTPTSQTSQHECMTRVPNEHILREIHGVPQNVDRRTPDTYGRSQLTKFKSPSDYEDIYGDRAIYKRPLSPVAANDIKKTYPSVNLAYKGYSPVNMIGPPRQCMQYDPVQLRKSPVTITRPHSADFLEYKSNQGHSETFVKLQQPRPKSSLDINKYSGNNCDIIHFQPDPQYMTLDPHRIITNPNKREPNESDNYFYSQEHYAEKMRKSAQYLHKIPFKYQSVDNSHRKHKERCSATENHMNSYNSRVPNFNSTAMSNNMSVAPEPMRSRSVLSEGSLLCAQDIENESSSPDYPLRSEQYINNNRNIYHDQFTRSASARLAHSQEDSKMISMEGERKREESMKRLLEWKQRMLQSPLNRKAQAQGYRLYPARPESNYIYQNCYQSVNPENKPKNLNSRKSVNSLVQYNSYSSDDEDNGQRSKKNMHSQAGRTVDTLPSNSDSLIHAHATSTTASLKEPELLVKCSKSNTVESHDAETEDLDEDTLTKPLKEFNKDSSTIAHVSSLKSEYSDKFQNNSVTTEIKANDALVKSILSEFQDKDKESLSEFRDMFTPTRDVDLLVEGNYMPMTPKKSLLTKNDTSSDLTLIQDDSDENHYVEMTQNANASVLNSYLQPDSSYHQPYEMVCFGEDIIEPLYMELKVPHQSANKKITEELPDILKSPKPKNNKSNKSDSSDADDEASKDLDSLDDQNQPRFSLSDNFRPASYYLGVSKSVPEFPDSSDSELVSPPPIPTSPPPLEDDEYNLDVSKSKRSAIRKDAQFNRNSDQFFNSNNTKSPNPSANSYRFSTQSLDTKVSFLSLKELKDRCSSFMYEGVEGSEDSFNRLSLNSESTIDVQSPSNLLKRKPVSEDFCSQLNSFENQNISDLQIYLRDMELPETLNLNHDYENLMISSKISELSTLEASNTSTEQITNKKGIVPLLTSDEFLLRGRPSSNSSVSAEMCSFLNNSNCSTPVVSLENISIPDVPLPIDIQENFLCSSLTHIAPYYYSDLSNNSLNMDCNAILTLNNQREQTNGSKKDITHIINPIKCNDQIRNPPEVRSTEDNPFTLAAEARSVSADFLNLTDKLGNIDKKNIYESDTLKRQKATESANSAPVTHPEARNLYPTERCNKFDYNELAISKVRKSHSLEGLLENVLNESSHTSQHTSETIRSTQTEASDLNATMTEGSYLWEEDSVWRERLRSVSQRHTKSLDDIDCLDDSEKSPKKPSRAITREVTYVNDILFKQDKAQEPQTKKFIKSAKNEIKKNGSFIIDREKLRQWDLLSSAPSDNQVLKISSAQVTEGNNVVVEIGEGIASRDNETPRDAASGSISLPRNAVELQRDTFPRVAKKIWQPNLQNTQALSTTNLERSYNYGSVTPGPYDVRQEDLKNSRNDLASNNSINVSAGELLGRTHEELVLLLIQLRRQSAQTFQAIESCYNEIDKLQACHNTDQSKRLENLQKLEKIKQNLIELEKQYEKGKPLVNLVDNMVKLGSLYRIPPNRNDMARYIRDRLEFNQHLQERRLLAEEKREWSRIETNQAQLQEKVQQLYQLDRLIQEESENLQNLQQDKEDIERALGGLRCRLMKGFNNPEEVEQARRQQVILENELSRVHLMLAQNSKKLEESVAGNARLEQELLVLKQKLQISRQQRSSPQFSNPGDSLPFSVGNSAVLESDLKRVQKKIGDLHKQREELSLQVRQLTDRSSNIQIQKASIPCEPLVTGKKKPSSVWRETDLDTMSIIDHGYSSDNNPCNSTTPLYINTDVKHGIPDSDYYERSLKSSDSTSDDTALSSNVLEKQEIKTVRIVKRESERRQRDREKSTATGKCDILLEEDDSSQNSSILFRPTSLQKPNNQILKQNANKKFSANTRPNSNKSSDLSPIFKSEAARQIITEVQDAPKVVRRTIPREKRRHYTAPNNNLIAENFGNLPADGTRLDTRRARDDLDIERALRQRIDAPDIVRSTLSNKELKYNEETIDNILSTPNKIIIPERYIPEQLPQLSPEEQERRMRKVESIKKMLSDTAIISSATSTLHIDDKNVDKKPSPTNKGVASTSITEEKKQREHLLQLNQILAKQVMEMSKVVAGNNDSEDNK